MTDGSPLGDLSELPSGLRIGQFLSVGVLGFVVDNLVLAGLVELAALSVLWGKPISFEAAVLVMFAANERWTFSEWGSAGLRSLGRRFLKSNLVRVGGFVVAYVVLVVLAQRFGVHYFLANTAGIGAGFVLNYVAESLFTWQVGAEPE